MSEDRTRSEANLRQPGNKAEGEAANQQDDRIGSVNQAGDKREGDDDPEQNQENGADVTALDNHRWRIPRHGGVWPATRSLADGAWKGLFARIASCREMPWEARPSLHSRVINVLTTFRSTASSLPESRYDAVFRPVTVE